MKGLDDVVRLQRKHRIWAFANALFGLAPIFAIANKFQPMLTDGYGGDLLPALLPDGIAAHYNSLLSAGLAALAASELLRRRFHKKHEKDLSL